MNAVTEEAPDAELVADEAEYLQRRVPLAGAHLVELGCGKAELARRLLARGLVARVTAFEVDARQHAANLAAAHPPALQFLYGGADDIALPDESADAVVMLKSLHHVPMDRLDRALQEIRRVLRPGGWLYVSEPVYAGAFNDLVRLFHDEGAVRLAAYAALQRAAQAGVLQWTAESNFATPLAFSDFDDFVDRVVRVTHSDIRLPDEVEQEVRRRFAAHLGEGGARFVRQMRVNLLRRP